jgi:hypothetical protein
MAIIESTDTILAAQKPLFWLSQDYYLRTSWDPFTKTNYFLDDAKTPTQGVRVFVETYNGLTMTAVIANFEPPKRATMTMEKGPFIFKKFAGTWTFRQSTEDTTHVTFRYNVQLRNIFFEFTIGWLVYRLLRRDIRNRLLALKTSAETTDILTKLTDQYE